MRDLKVTGVDGADLQLVDDDGGRYRLSVDDQVRQSVAAAGNEASPGADAPPVGLPDAGSQAEPTPAARPVTLVPAQSAAAPASDVDLPHLPPGELVTPRAVQELLRAGHSVEQVATASGWDLAKVERYAAPIESERSYIAGLAQDLPVGATATDTAATVGDRVAARLHDRGVAGDTVAWDAHRTAGRGWVVVCRFSAGGRTREATWLFRAATRTLNAVDDEARWLGEDERTAGGPIPAPAAPVKVFDVEAEGGVTEPSATGGSAASIGSSSPAQAQGSADASRPVDLVSAMQARSRGRRTRASRNRTGRTPTDTAATAPPAAADPDISDAPGVHSDLQPASVQQPGQTGHEADRAVPDETLPIPTVDDLGHDPVTGTVDLFGAVALQPGDALSGVAPVDGSDAEPAQDAGDVEEPVQSRHVEQNEPEPSDERPEQVEPTDSAGLHDPEPDLERASEEARPTDDASTSDDASREAAARNERDDTVRSVGSVVDDQPEDLDEPEDDPSRAEASPTPPRRPGSARSGRPSVPSWDDIMFGGRRGRD